MESTDIPIGVVENDDIAVYINPAAHISSGKVHQMNDASRGALEIEVIASD